MSSAVFSERVVGPAEIALGKFIPGVDLKLTRSMGGDDFYCVVSGVRHRLREAINPDQIIELESQGRLGEISHRAKQCLLFDSLLREFESEQ
ncbi:MAG: hypothetical protein IT410_00540 [Candidatus Doudnabacteria bacterium]|nr:hypothetical protein [Candidatus Doudnabacteria bacterium]